LLDGHSVDTLKLSAQRFSDLEMLTIIQKNKIHLEGFETYTAKIEQFAEDNSVDDDTDLLKLGKLLKKKKLKLSDVKELPIHDGPQTDVKKKGKKNSR